MGRPREYDDRISTGVRLPIELYERLKATAAERDVSVNRLLVSAAEKYLEHGLPPLP